MGRKGTVQGAWKRIEASNPVAPASVPATSERRSGKDTIRLCAVQVPPVAGMLAGQKTTIRR
jgi:hypothetical protein